MARREEYKETGRREEYREQARREEYKEVSRREEGRREDGRREDGRREDGRREDGRREEARETGNGAAMWLATATEQVKARYPAERELGKEAREVAREAELRPDFDIPEPPLEYAEARKDGDKRGILSSIFDKVRSKEESRKSVECLPFGSKEEHRRSQPLLDNIIDCTGLVRSNNSELKRSGDSVESILAKPYEPPALGKSSRITPVGGEEVTAVSSQSGASSCLETDSVEVLSVIRYNKVKMSAPPSTLHSVSGSDTESVLSQVLHCKSETGWTGELWSNRVLLILKN